MDGYELRLGVPEDAREIARTMELGFEGYRSFAPAGWEPPPVFEEQVRGRLADEAIWCEVALADGEMAGHVSFMPATSHPFWPDEGDPRLAQLWQLFVREPHWGTGLAVRLHADAIEAAARRGFERMRLYTAEPQARARRFYEREGWRMRGVPFMEEQFGMNVVEYRRDL